ncbi:ECF transporter S component [Eubacteriales bacterium OttesenSCG-928-A19]|nr:ECF transporter S component [Eubacteriales bacterium OttesenSCG-928-A19]
MKKEAVQSMVLTALFVALILLLGMTPLGLIPLGFINVTILCIPVIVGTILLGLRTGMVLGACFGLTSALSAFGLSMTPPSALASALVAASPLLAIVMCLVPRLLIPVTTHLAYRLAARGVERSGKALPIAAAAGSLTNTVLYLGMMLLFYALTGLDSAAVLGIIGGTGLIAGISEAAVAAILVTPITMALWKVQRT